MARNKFGAIKTTIDGIKFDSKGEALRWQQLKLLQRGGEISNLKRQVDVEFRFTNEKGEIVEVKTPTGLCMKYVADFEYRDNRRKCTVLEDFKGFMTPEAQIKIALVKAFYGITVQVVR